MGNWILTWFSHLDGVERVHDTVLHDPGQGPCHHVSRHRVDGESLIVIKVNFIGIGWALRRPDPTHEVQEWASTTGAHGRENGTRRNDWDHLPTQTQPITTAAPMA
jgi:hypothetical protein